MKKILFILVILLSSCSWNTDLNEYEQFINNNTRADEYYWYYNKELFIGVDSCYTVGTLESKYNNEKYQINHQVPICNDTIYIVKKYIAEKNNIFNGVIYIKNKEPFRLITELN